MINLALSILSVLQALSSTQGETPEQEAARLWPTAVALAEHTQDIKRLSFALAQGRFESHFDREVGWLQCERHQCDPRSGKHLAKGFWQNHRIEDTPEWASLWDSIRGQASVQEAVQLQLSMQERMWCGGNTAMAFSAHDGKGCRITKRGNSREAFRQKVEARLKKEIRNVRAESR